MTVKKIVGLLKDAKSIKIAYAQVARPFDVNDTLQMEAFGDYLVCGIRSYGDKSREYEVELAMRPVKVGEA